MCEWHNMFFVHMWIRISTCKNKTRLIKTSEIMRLHMWILHFHTFRYVIFFTYGFMENHKHGTEKSDTSHVNSTFSHILTGNWPLSHVNKNSHVKIKRRHTWTGHHISEWLFSHMYESFHMRNVQYHMWIRSTFITLHMWKKFLP